MTVEAATNLRRLPDRGSTDFELACANFIRNRHKTPHYCLLASCEAFNIPRRILISF
jgi:hypothetical protein